MNLLLDGLPEEVEIAGQKVPISTDFRTGVLFEEALLDPQLDNLDKLQTALSLYFPGVRFDVDTVEEAFNALVWFYRCGSAPKRRRGRQTMTPKRAGPLRSRRFPMNTTPTISTAPLCRPTAWIWRASPSTGGSFERYSDRYLRTPSWSRSSATAREATRLKAQGAAAALREAEAHIRTAGLG